jgi:hypothetical protein
MATLLQVIGLHHFKLHSFILLGIDPGRAAHACAESWSAAVVCLQDIRDVAEALPAEKQAARASPDSTDTDQKMDQGPTKSDSTTGVGLVSNAAPLTVSILLSMPPAQAAHTAAFRSS